MGAYGRTYIPTIYAARKRGVVSHAATASYKTMIYYVSMTRDGDREIDFRYNFIAPRTKKLMAFTLVSCHEQARARRAVTAAMNRVNSYRRNR